MISTLAVALLLSVGCERPARCRDFRAGTRGAKAGGGAAENTTPQFLFAAGAGMTADCACTAVTGAKGETITVARASSAYCTKDGGSDVLVSGDMVSCSSNTPRVEAGGVRVEGAATNYTLRSDELDNGGVWTPYGSGAAAGVVTANQANTPWGAATADQLALASTGAAAQSGIYQYPACPDVADTAMTLSVYVQGKQYVSDAGTIDLILGDGIGYVGGDCNYVSGTITRCVLPNVIRKASPPWLLIGNFPPKHASVARPAQTVYISGVQCEAADHATSYVASAGSNGVRSGDLYTTPITASGGAISMSATVLHTGVHSDYHPASQLYFDANNHVTVTSLGAKTMADFYISSAHSVLNSLGNWLSSTMAAVGLTYASSSRATCLGSDCKPTSGALTLPTGSATLYIGGQRDGGSVDGIVKGVCYDTSSTLCRPGGASTASCPYAGSEAETYALVGDSIMLGGWDIKIVDQVRDSVCASSRTATSFALNGGKIEDCAVQWDAGVRGHAYRGVAINCGVNNLLNGVNDAGVAWATMAGLLGEIIDGGYSVAVANVLPCAGYASCGSAVSSEVDLFNASEATWCAARSSKCTLVDLNAQLKNTSEVPPFASARLADRCLPSADNLHPNNVCSTEYGAAVAAGLLSIAP